VRRLRNPPNGYEVQEHHLYGACAGCLEAIPTITCLARPASSDSTTAAIEEGFPHHPAQRHIAVERHTQE
jgi:hypothetical protein